MPRDHPPAPQHQRADGAFELRFGSGGALRRLFQRAPLRVLFPTQSPASRRWPPRSRAAGWSAARG